MDTKLSSASRSTLLEFVVIVCFTNEADLISLSLYQNLSLADLFHLPVGTVLTEEGV